MRQGGIKRGRKYKKNKSINGSYFLPQAHMEVMKHKGGSWGQQQSPAVEGRGAFGWVFNANFLQEQCGSGRGAAVREDE